VLLKNVTQSAVDGNLVAGLGHSRLFFHSTITRGSIRLESTKFRADTWLARLFSLLRPRLWITIESQAGGFAVLGELSFGTTPALRVRGDFAPEPVGPPRPHQGAAHPPA
jgi:hypothetical protein